eukprot:JP436097.1.p6 GENE.JP436097.1~~JP436097.1.p6  ORF type:complete len:51 (+),score=8.13 JP436097.1:329-481(+)
MFPFPLVWLPFRLLLFLPPCCTIPPVPGVSVGVALGEQSLPLWMLQHWQL